MCVSTGNLRATSFWPRPLEIKGYWPEWRPGTEVNSYSPEDNFCFTHLQTRAKLVSTHAMHSKRAEREREHSRIPLFRKKSYQVILQGAHSKFFLKAKNLAV